MSRINPAKMIGLIRSIADGSYAPTNETSKNRLHAVYAVAGVPQPYAPHIRPQELLLVKEIARAQGFHVITTHQAVRS